MDDHGHGSHCSGTIGAKGNDGKGIVGVNWDVRIMGVKFLDANGAGSLENALRAIDYATKMGAKIMSNSWGGNEYSDTMKAAIQKANDAGALFVVAAGNDGGDNDASPSYPASFDIPNILSVAAIDNKGQMASFSNYGHRTVSVAAPGVNIVSSITGSGYDSWSGTSMATPHVSGVAALLASHEPGLTNLQLKDRLINTSKPLDGTRGKIHGGLINAYAALTNDVSLPDANDPVNWATKDATFSTIHPYLSNTKQTFILKVDGAKQVAAYFAKFETEKTYDKVEIYNKAGKLVQTLSGKNDDSFSQPVVGDSMKVVFTSDDGVNAYGIDITKIAYK